MVDGRAPSVFAGVPSRVSEGVIKALLRNFCKHTEAVHDCAGKSRDPSIASRRADEYMDLGLAGKKLLVTGGSRGIGREVCRALLEENAIVEFCARDATQLKATTEELSALGSVFGSSVDVADATALATWVQDAAERMGGSTVS